MATVAIMVGGAVLNAATFIGGNYLAKYLSGDSGQAALDEKKRHDLALEKYQRDYAQYQKDRTQLLDYIMIQSGTEIPVRYHRLRASIPGSLWRWRIVSGWQWTGSPEHINVLEARACLTTLKWRAAQLKQQDTRFVHLVDSLVVLHCLTRGRSSSKKLRRTVMRIGSLLLATGLQPVWGYIESSQNPADNHPAGALRNDG